MSTAHDSPLGRPTDYAGRYDASRLFPIARADKRAELGIRGAPAFFGGDIWNAYELSWLDPKGRPRTALARIDVPAASPHIIESKSLKLYLNGFMQEPIEDIDALADCLRRDLTAAAGAPVAVELSPPERWGELGLRPLFGASIDGADTTIDHYGPPQAALLSVHRDLIISETLTSDTLKSNCPVTGQPDWASLQIRYRGPRIGRAGLLRYIASYREHADFHEHCVERIYLDLLQHCEPDELFVYARYTRRGGLDINPWRSNVALPAPPNQRTPRQ